MQKICRFIADGNVPDFPYPKIRHLLGTAESGIEDIGENHRIYLIKKLKDKYQSFGEPVKEIADTFQQAKQL